MKNLKTTFNTSSYTTEQFTSSWFYLSNQTRTPCWGEISIDDSSVVCTSTDKKIALHILLEVPNFGKVMVKTSIVEAGKKYDLLSCIIEGRVEQINEFLLQRKINKTSIYHKELKEILKVKEKNKKIHLLFKLGEEMVINESERILSEKIKNKEMKKFLLGAQAFGIKKGPKYKKIHKENFDLGIAPFYLFLLKPESQKETDWTLSDDIVNWLVSTNRPIKAHPLMWLHQAAIPEWMKTLTFPELKAFLRTHITEVVERYKDKIHMWDIVNEIPTADANFFNLNMQQLIEITKMTSDIVHRIAPDAERIVNISDIFGPKSYIHDSPSIPPIYFLKLLDQEKIEYESIGIQFYMGMRKEFACRELLDLCNLIDEYAEFGKPLHFSELGWPSKHDVDPTCFFAADHPEVAGRWHSAWSESVQAEFLKKTYTLFASYKNSKSITWWDITDNGTHKDIGSRFIPFSGLTRRDYSAKPALLEIQKFRKKVHK